MSNLVERERRKGVSLKTPRKGKDEKQGIGEEKLDIKEMQRVN